MSGAVAPDSRSVQQDLRYHLPRWMAVFVIITAIPDLLMFPAAGRGLLYIPGL
jgi:hypothetical protein